MDEMCYESSVLKLSKIVVEKGIIAIFQVVEGQDEIQPGW